MTTLAQQSVVYDVQAFAVYTMLTSDIVGGSSPTYDAAVTLEGISDVSLTPDITSADLKGDGGRTIARYARNTMWTCSATYGRIGLDALAVMIGDSPVITTPSSQNAWVHTMPNYLPFFKAAFLMVDTDNGIASIIATMYKCSLKSATFLDPKTDAFSQPKIEFEAIALNSNNVIGSIIEYDSLQTLPA